MKLSTAQRLVLEDMNDKASLWRFQGRYKVTFRSLLNKGLIVFNNTSAQHEITDSGRAALSSEDTQRCGGQLRSSALGNPGDRVACPYCKKQVTLRRPFNGHITGWVQVPMHNRLQPK